MTRVVRIQTTRDQRSQVLLTPVDQLGDDPERRRAFDRALMRYIEESQNDNA